MNPLTISFKAAAEPGVSEDQPGYLPYALAHELRNPLANINLSVEMLEAELTNKDLIVYLDIIKRSSLRIKSMVNDLVQNQHAEEAPTAEYSLYGLIDKVMEIAADRIRLKNITVKKEYDLQDHLITLSRQKMEVALTNIIINAVEAMPAQGGELNLVTRSMHDKYMLRIEDNGCGISKANMANIFKAYYTNKPGGLGLGLTIVYDYLQSNNVGLHAESEEGKGTRFILLFDKNILV